MLGSVIAIMVMGFVTGALARLAVPGPDPMPVWLTIAIGLLGSWGGGFIVAILLVWAYRRFVQKRPFSGPEAQKFPERGWGIDRFRQRRQQFEDLTRQHQQMKADGDSIADQVRKLGELRDAGVLTDEEFETKKAQLLGRT
jgi:uncharacterized membrane protein YeaQ/YmgE (transglycosylase-associated protein family)